MADLASQMLSPKSQAAKRSSTLQQRRSSTVLRQPDFDGDDDDHDTLAPPSSSRISLAHELAAALMPDSHSSSRLLADEFGIEFDEGDEEGAGEDDEEAQRQEMEYQDSHHSNEPGSEYAFGEPQRVLQPTPAKGSQSRSPAHFADELSPPQNTRRERSPPTFEQDPLVVLSQTLKSTDLFLNQLRRVDVDAPSASTPHHEPRLERAAADMLRNINETTRTREGQVRELLECEREFRKIAGELGGNDLLGDLDALEYVDGLVDHQRESTDDDVTIGASSRPVSGMWDDEDDPDPHSLESLAEEDEDGGIFDPVSSPAHDAETFLPPPPPQT